MSVDIAIIFSGTAVALSAIGVLTTLWRNAKQVSNSQNTQLTTVIVKLEKIGEDVKDVKSDLKDTRGELTTYSERLARVEQKVINLDKEVFNQSSSRKDSQSPRDQ